nr:Asp-tRNA(Asn)/Glu-tRNA(Gln) amidotransferase subunit GatA [Oceanococcus sp. HetDA_MAG_MS8]
MSAWHECSLAQLRQALDERRVDSVELTQYFLDHIRAHNGTLNAVIAQDDERALRQAQASTQAQGPLAGLPILHKDIFCTQGLRTSCGSKMLADWVPPYDATIVEQLNQAGMVTLGKANMDEFAMGSSNETSYFGPVRNPWNTDCVPGGSSGGSAAAVAAGLVPVATGSDTGGSIRQPAALTGITGIKPTYGRCSRYGMIAFASSLDQAGVFARTAQDCAWVLQAMSGVDRRDSTSADHPVDDLCALLDQPLKGLRVGKPVEFFGEGLDAETGARVEEGLVALQKLGAEIVDIHLPRLDLCVPVYYVIAPAEAASNLSRYDGVRFGLRCDNPKDLDDLYTRTRSEGFGREVQRRITIGTYVLSHGYYDAYYVKAQQVRRLVSEDFSRAFESVDVIASPTTQGPAFEIGAKSADPVAMYLNDIYTIAANLAGLPGISIPAGLASGLPVGLQLVGPPFTEARLLQVAHQLQTHTDHHLQRPTAFMEAAQ